MVNRASKTVEFTFETEHAYKRSIVFEGAVPVEQNLISIKEIQHNIENLVSIVENLAEKKCQSSRLRAQDLRKIRILKNDIFGSDLFSDPAWDILLDLFVYDDNGMGIPLTSVGIDQKIPISTLSRYVDRMALQGFIIKTEDTVDKRRILLAISPTYRKELENIFSD